MLTTKSPASLQRARLLLLALSIRLGRVIPVLNDDIGGRLRLLVVPVIEDLLRSSRIPSLGIQGRSCARARSAPSEQTREKGDEPE